MAAITILRDFGAQENKVCHSIHCFPSICHEVMVLTPWSPFFECWVLSQLFHSPLSPSSRDSLVLPLGWCRLHIWGYWYFSWQSIEIGSVNWPRHRAWYILGASKMGAVIVRGGREGRLNMRNAVLYFCLTSAMMSQPRPVKTQPVWALGFFLFWPLQLAGS